MHLRDTIKPPQRYEAELFVQPPSPPRVPRPRIPAVAKPTFGPPPYVDYDPNLPPAVFPTLDEPSGSISHQPSPTERQSGEETGDEDIAAHDGSVSGGARMADIGPRAAEVSEHRDYATDRIEEDSISAEDVSKTGSLDNQGPGNASNRRDSLDANYQMQFIAEVESSDDGDDPGQGRDFQGLGESANRRQRIKWGDLNPLLQVEIVENIRRIHNWPKVVSMLHLTPDDEKSVAEHSTKRTAQIERERRQLKDMQEKQLRALLRIDNSILKQSRVPTQLVFRSASKQYIRSNRVRANPDYLMSKVGEVLTARKYLRSIGLDPRLAGEWRNDLVVMRGPRNELEEDELEWKSGSVQPAEQDTLSCLGITPANSPIGETTNNGDKLSTKVCFINRIGGRGDVISANSLPLKPRDPRTHQLSAARQIFNRRQSQPVPRQHTIPPVAGGGGPIVRLRIGPHGAAQIRHCQEEILPCDTVFSPVTTPVPLRAFNREPTISQSVFGLEQSLDGASHASAASDSAQTTWKSTDPDQPVERTLAGIWCYKPGDREAEACGTSSTHLKDQLEILPAQAENVPERSTETGPLESEESKRECISLPIRGFPVSLRHGNGLPSDHPSDVTPGSTILSTPTDNKGNIREACGASRRLPRLTASFKADDQDRTHVVEAEHGPAYSPISPPSEVDPHRTSEGNQGKANLSGNLSALTEQTSMIASCHSILSKECHDHQVVSGAPAGKATMQAVSGLQAASSDVMVDCVNAVNQTRTSNPDPSWTAASVELNSVIPVPELDSDAQTSLVRENPLAFLPAETLISQPKTALLVLRKRAPARRTTVTRRSVRINGLGGRILRPRT